MGFGRTGLASFSGDRFEAINAPGAKQKLGTFCAESPGCGGSESTGSAGDHHPLVL
jgi:hypothetical protein